MKKSLHLLLLSTLSLVLLTACQEEDLTPPQTATPPTDPNPIDTTGTDTTAYDTYMLFEMFNSSSGQGLKNTVDSISFDNSTSGFHKTWLPDVIQWHDVNSYGSPGNYTQCWIPTPTYGDQVQTVVYFNSGEQKNCWVTYNDLIGASSTSILTSFGTNTYVHTRSF